MESLENGEHSVSPETPIFFSRRLPKLGQSPLTPLDALYPGKGGLSWTGKDQCWTGLLKVLYFDGGKMDEGRVCGISFAGPNLTYSEIDLRFSILICSIYCDLVRLKLSFLSLCLT